MIGKVKVTSSGYDPDGPMPHDPTLGPQPTTKELESAFLADSDAQVKKYNYTPLSSEEKCVVGIVLAWVRQEYFLVKKSETLK